MDYDVLIRGGLIVDGSGKPAYHGDVALRDGKIAYAGPSGKIAGQDNARVIPAEGLVVCPGLIDAHCHTDMYAKDCPDAEGKIMQGVTTDVCGLCGDSPAPIGRENLEEYVKRKEYRLPDASPIRPCSFAEYRDRMNRSGNTTNMALFVGNANLRVCGVGYENRAASPGELDRMKGMLRESMEAGAYGLSTGLTYVPSMFASREELTALSRVIAPFGGIYNSHMRDEADRVRESIQEVIAIARDSGCRGHISHLKASGAANHGKSEMCLELIHRAVDQGVDITFDVYPYTAGSCGLRTLLPPEILELGLEDDYEAMKNPQILGRIRGRLGEADWDNMLKNFGSGNIVVSAADKNTRYEGKSIREIGESLGVDDAEAVIKVLGDTGANAGIVYHALCEEDLRRFMNDPLGTIGTDAFARSYTGPTAAGKPHPRNYGGFARMIRKYLLDERLLPLEAGIRKMTSLPAEHFGIAGRGLLKSGYEADVMIFDPEKIRETGTFERPAVQPEGIVWVFISGEAAVERGVFRPVRRGRVLGSPVFR